MLHTSLIALHAAAGCACFAAGMACLPPQRPRSWRFRAHAGPLLTMLVSVAAEVALRLAEVAVRWAELPARGATATTGPRWR